MEDVDKDTSGFVDDARCLADHVFALRYGFKWHMQFIDRDEMDRHRVYIPRPSWAKIHTKRFYWCALPYEHVREHSRIRIALRRKMFRSWKACGCSRCFRDGLTDLDCKEYAVQGVINPCLPFGCLTEEGAMDWNRRCVAHNAMRLEDLREPFLMRLTAAVPKERRWSSRLDDPNQEGYRRQLLTHAAFQEVANWLMRPTDELKTGVPPTRRFVRVDNCGDVV